MANNETTFIISAVDKTAGAIKSVQGNIGQIGSEVTKLSGIIGGFAATAGVGLFASMIKGAIDAADELKDLSKSTGLAVEQLAGLKLASKQSGADLQGTADAINKLSKNIGENAEKFAKIGVSAKDPLEAFKQLADVFVKIDDPQKRAAFGAEALGKSWQKAAPLLAEGGAGIQKMVDNGAKLSGVTQAMADDADAFNDSLEELRTQMGGVATKIASDLLPIFKAMSQDMGIASDEAGDMSGAFSPLTETFRAVAVLGGNVAFVLKGVGTELGGMAAQIAAFASGDIKGGMAIGDMMKADAEKARKAFDIWEEGVISAGKTTKETTAATEKLTAAQNAAVSGFIGTERAAKATAGAYDALIARSEVLAKFFKEAAEELKGIERANEEYAKSVAAIIDPLNQQAAALEAQVEFYGMEESQIQAVIIARLEEARVIAQQQDGMAGLVENLEKEIDARKRIASAAGSLEARKATADAAKKAAADWDKTADLIEKSLTDALLRGFESGKGFGENFRDTLVNMFKTMVLRPVIQGVVQGGLNAVGLGAPGVGGAAGSAGNLLSTGNSIYNIYQNGIAGSAGNALSSVGNLIGSEGLSAYGTGLQAAGAGFDVTGAVSAYEAAGMGNVASSLSSGFSMGGGVASAGTLASTAIGSGVVGGAGTVGLASGVSGAVAGIGGGTVGAAGAAASSGLMSTVGAAMPYVGAALAIASILGGGGLFGKKAKPPKMNLVNVPSDYETSWTQTDTPFGKIVGAAKHSKNFAELFEPLKKIGELDKIISSQMSGAEIAKVSKDLAHTGGGEFNPSGTAVDDWVSARLNRITDSIGGWVGDLADTFSGSLQDTYTAVAGILSTRSLDSSESIAHALLAGEGASLKREGEQLAATFVRLVTSLTPVNKILDDLNLTLLESSLAGASAASTLADAFGGIATMQTATADYYAGFYSEAEKMDTARKAVADQFVKLNQTMPATREGFRDLAESLDLTTASGATAFAGLMALAPAFGVVADAAKAAFETTRKSLLDETDGDVDAAFAALERAVAAEKSRLETSFAASQKSWQKSVDAATEIRDTLDGLAGTLSSAIRTVVVESDALNLSRRIAAQGLLDTAFTAAQSGQSLEPFADRITDAIADLSAPSDDLYATFEDYARAQGRANGVLVSLKDSALAQKSVAQMTLAAIEGASAIAEGQYAAEIARLDQTLVDAQTQISVLRGIDVSVMSVAAAIANLGAARSVASTVKAALAPKAGTSASASTLVGIYESELGRAPDAEGLTYWAQQAAAGMSTAEITSYISNSSEGQVADMYSSMLGRDADPAGAAYWSGLIDSGVSAAAVAEGIRNSDEYRNSHAGGLERVPYDGYKATLHAGEAVVDAKSTQAITRYFGGGGGNSNDALVIEIKALRADNALLRAEVRAVATNTGKTHRALERVIPEGDALQTRAIA